MPLYAVLQLTPGKPDLDALRQAFRAVPWLNDLDAMNMTGDGYGIIVEDLSLDQAQEIGNALENVGIHNRVMNQDDLPALAAAKQVRRLDCLPENLVIYDPLGRPVNVPWEEVRLLAAGLVRLPEMQRTEKERAVNRGTGWQGGSVPTVMIDVAEREVRKDKLMLELLIGGSCARFRVMADKCRYDYLQTRLRRRVEENFRLLVKDLVAYSVNALLTQGAAALADDALPVCKYPSRHAFEEEIIWLFWI
jgi:hypothetical protein